MNQGNEQNNKPLAIGLELKYGQWILEQDGTLHFSGGSVLDGGAFHRYCKKVKRIVIDDFFFIADHMFENFANCEEVVLNRIAVSVGHAAFAHCHKLNSTKNRPTTY